MKSKLRKRIPHTKKSIVLALIALVILVGGVAYALSGNDNEAGDTEVTSSGDSAASGDTTTDATNANDQPANQGPATSNPQTPATPVAFSVSDVSVPSAEVVYNTDKLGNKYRACLVSANITATAAGTAKYYWQVYHPEYYSPSYDTAQEAVVFDQQGTKTVSLPTYVSDDNRRFTLFVVEPNAVSKATETKVMCPTT